MDTDMDMEHTLVMRACASTLRFVAAVQSITMVSIAAGAAIQITHDGGAQA